MASPRRPRTYKPPETVNMTLRLPKNLNTRIVAEAKHAGAAKHGLILTLIAEALDQRAALAARALKE